MLFQQNKLLLNSDHTFEIREKSMTEIQNRIGSHNFDICNVKIMTRFYKGKKSNVVRGGEF